MITIYPAQFGRVGGGIQYRNKMNVNLKRNEMDENCNAVCDDQESACAKVNSYDSKQKSEV